MADKDWDLDSIISESDQADVKKINVTSKDPDGASSEIPMSNWDS